MVTANDPGQMTLSGQALVLTSSSEQVRGECVSDKNLWTMPWRLFLSKHRLVNMSPLRGWVGGKLALSLDSVGGWQRAPLKMGQRSEFTFIHCRLLGETATSSKVGKRCIFY